MLTLQLSAVKQKKLEEKYIKSIKLNYRETQSVNEITTVSEDHFYTPNQFAKPFRATGKSGSPLKERLMTDKFNRPLTSKEEVVESFYYGKDSPLRLDRIKTLIILEAIMIVDQLVEGNDKISSVLGITRCSFSYWSVFSFFIIFCIWYARYSYYQIKKEYEMRESNASGSSSFKITSRQAEDKMNKIIILCFIGGVTSGMLGVGGGIVMAPLMLELGVSPRTAASTSNFLLIFTSSAATILFFLSGKINYSFGITLAIPCCLASLIGSKYINQYVSRTNKNSLLVYCLFYVMICSLIILPINGIKRAMYDLKNGSNVFELGSFCL